MPNNTIAQRVPSVPQWNSVTPTATAGKTTGRAAGLDVPPEYIVNELKKDNLVSGGLANAEQVYFVEQKKVGQLVRY